MKLRTMLLSAALGLGALGALTVPALAQDGGAPAEGKRAHPGHEKMLMGDTDGDGLISKAEFSAMHDKRFAEMDSNSDGQISKDEMKAHRETMKAKFKEKRKEWKERKENGEVPPSAE